MCLLLRKIFGHGKIEQITNSIEQYLLKNNTRILLFFVIAALFLNIEFSKSTIHELRIMYNQKNESLNEKESHIEMLKRFNNKLFSNVDNFGNEMIELNKHINEGEIKIVNFISYKDKKTAVSILLRYIKTLKHKYSDITQYLVLDIDKMNFNDFYLKRIKIDNIDIITPSLAVLDNNNRILFISYFDGNETTNELFLLRDYLFSLLKNIY